MGVTHVGEMLKIADKLKHEEPMGRKDSRMARKRPYGSGCLMKVGRNWAIRWREPQSRPDGSQKRVLRYESLGGVSRKEATRILNERLAAVQLIRRPDLNFSELVDAWKTSILPLYKHSTRKMHLHILERQILPRFRNVDLAAITKQDVQMFIAQLKKAGYAPNSIDHFHNVFSAVLGMGVKWGYIKENPARGVELPKLTPLRPKWVLTIPQAHQLLNELSPLARTIVGLAILTGMRRGELLALRWRSLDEEARFLDVSQAVYDGVFDIPKTPTSKRKLPLSSASLDLLIRWKQQAKRTAGDDLIFGTRLGKPQSPGNILRRHIFPACDRIGLPRATWLTFRRTYSSWSHDSGVPNKVTAELMGHSNVYTTLNVYTKVMESSARTAVEKIGEELFSPASEGCPQAHRNNGEPAGTRTRDPLLKRQMLCRLSYRPIRAS